MMLRSLFVSLLLITSAGDAFTNHQSSSSGTPEGEASKRAPDKTAVERPAELILLINNVRSAPPEFAADLLISIAESARVTGSDWKKELLEEAFRVASDCQYQLPQRSVGPYPVDTRAGYLGEAFRLKLDTLSLRCRIVQSVLRLDKAKALHLFGEIGKLKFPSLNCDSGLVYEVSDYYKTAAKLFLEAFSVKEKQRGDHIRFLEALIDEVSSPIQIPPAANLLRSLGISREQRENLVTSLASRVAKVAGDDRSFSNSIYSVNDEIARLLHTCNEQGVSTIELIRSLRSYYVKHFSSNRCSDTLRNTGDKGPLPHEITQFNKRIRALAERNVSEIEADEVKPSRIEGGVNVHFYWQSPRSKKLMQKFKQLKFGGGNKPLTQAEADRVEWRVDLGQFIKELIAWDQNDEDSVEDYFHQKCNLFEGLMSLPLRTSERDEVIREFVPFLWRFDLKSLRRIEWFWHAKNLLPRALDQQGGEISASRRALLASSNNLVLYAYTEVWNTLSSQPKENTEPAKVKSARNP